MFDKNRKSLSLLLTFLFFCSASLAKETLRSSVSPEFPEGLHAKYLQYIADKMSMDLTLYPMPFARRIQALKKGDIDIMVGLKGTQPDSEGFDKLLPPYERLQSIYFIKKENQHRLAKPEDLGQLVVGLTIDEKALLERAEQLFRKTVPVTTLNQKIELLELGRIDSFVHFEHSAQYMIDKKGLTNKIVPAPYQNSGIRDYHVTISTASPLYVYKEKFEKIIQEGLVAKDFVRIRQTHYQELEKKKGH